MSARAPGHRGGVQMASLAQSKRNYRQHDLSKEGAQKRDISPQNGSKQNIETKKNRTQENVSKREKKNTPEKPNG